MVSLYSLMLDEGDYFVTQVNQHSPHPRFSLFRDYRLCVCVCQLCVCV